MSAQTVHVWWTPKFGQHMQASIVDGDVATVASETIRATASHGHQASPVSALRTLDGELVQIYFDVEVTLDNGRTFVWRHLFTRPNEPWSRELKLDTAPDSAASEQVPT